MNKFKIKKILCFLLALSAGDAKTPFPSAMEICTSTRYGDLGAIDIIAKAALVHAYSNPRAELSYPGWDIRRFNCDYELKGCTGTYRHTHDGNIVFYNIEHKVCIVSFKGTEGEVVSLDPEWRQDFATRFHRASEDISEHYKAGKLGKFFDNEPKAHLHLGFKEMATSCETEVLNIVDQFVGNAKQGVKFIITGHSMGAALASLFACSLFQHLEIENNYNRSISIVTFGGPKFCNSFAAGVMQQKLKGSQDSDELDELIRIINSGIIRDPVSRLSFPREKTKNIVKEAFASAVSLPFYLVVRLIIPHDHSVELEDKTYTHVESLELVLKKQHNCNHIVSHLAECYVKNCFNEDGSPKIKIEHRLVQE